MFKFQFDGFIILTVFNQSYVSMTRLNNFIIFYNTTFNQHNNIQKKRIKNHKKSIISQTTKGLIVRQEGSRGRGYMMVPPPSAQPRRPSPQRGAGPWWPTEITRSRPGLTCLIVQYDNKCPAAKANYLTTLCIMASLRVARGEGANC